MYLFILAILIFIFGYSITTNLIKFSVKNNIHKKIRSRDIHKLSIPNIGGVAIFLSVVFGSILIYSFKLFSCQEIGFLCFSEDSTNNLWYLLPSMTFVFFIGIIDDVYDISFKYKFITQLIVAFVLVFLCDIYVESFYGVFGLYKFHDLSLRLFSMILVIFIINSYNFIDGADTLAALVGIIISCLLCYIFYNNSYFFDFILSFFICFSLLSFLPFNNSPAKIFMGDSGSLFVGFLFSYLALKACNLPINNECNINPVFVLSILSYQSIDTLRVFLIRLKNKKSPFIADKNHLHHFLIKNQFKHKIISIYAIIYTLFLSTLTYFFIDYSSFSFFIISFFAIFLIRLRTVFFLCQKISGILKF